MNLSDTTIGIVIGSAFTVLGVIVQGAMSWFLNWRTHKMTLREQYEKEKRAQAGEMWHRKEAAYQNFADIIGLALMLAGESSEGKTCPLPESITSGNILKEMSNALTSIQLYGSSKIADEVCKFMKHIANIRKPSPQDIEEMDMALQNLTKEMKADLSQSGIG